MPFVWCWNETAFLSATPLSSVFHWITDGFFPDKIYVWHEKRTIFLLTDFWDYGCMYHIDDFQNRNKLYTITNDNLNKKKYNYVWLKIEMQVQQSALVK